MTDAPFTRNGARIVLRDWREVNLAPFAAWLQPGHRWKELGGPYYPLPSAGDVTAMVARDRAVIAAGDWPAPEPVAVVDFENGAGDQPGLNRKEAQAGAVLGFHAANLQCELGQARLAEHSELLGCG